MAFDVAKRTFWIGCKLARLLSVAGLLVTFAAFQARSDTHYVSHQGSNTFPYTSWATATDSVQSAIDAADEGDTILVDAGEYVCDSVVLKQSQALIGKGSDSSCLLHSGVAISLVYLADSCLLEGFHLMGIVDTANNGRITYHLSNAVEAAEDVGGVIQYNTISDADECVAQVATDRYSVSKQVIIRHNYFHSFETAVKVLDAPCLVESNVFHATAPSIGAVVSQLYGRSCKVYRNRFVREDRFQTSLLRLHSIDSVEIENNILTSSSSADGISLEINHPSFPYATSCIVRNNLISGGQVGLLAYVESLIFVNNIVTETTLGDVRYVLSGATTESVGFNLYWQNVNSQLVVDTTARLSAGSIFEIPMFVSEGDYHLQAYSPAIDAGDTLILDLDGSRSDIGPYGGPLGEQYAYEDLPPIKPAAFYAVPGHEEITLLWNRNQEADFAYYELYADTVSISTPGFDMLLATLYGDTSYVDTGLSADRTYFYRLRACDGQNNHSELSEEVARVVTLVSSEDGPITPVRIQLAPSYPNPFNARTNIPISVMHIGNSETLRPEIDIYDVLGRLQRRYHPILRGEGVHVIAWDGKNGSDRILPSGTYLVLLRLPDGTKQSQQLTLIK